MSPETNIPKPPEAVAPFPNEHLVHGETEGLNDIFPPQFRDIPTAAVNDEAVPSGTGPETIVEVASVAVDERAPALLGLKKFIAERRLQRSLRRMERAGATMERMDHKNALYADMGYIALKGRDENFKPSATASSEPTRPRTWSERHVDKRLDKKAQKLEDKRREKLFLDKVYGGSQALDRSGRTAHQKTRKQELKLAKSDYKQGSITAEQLRTAKNAFELTTGSIGEQYGKYKNGELSTEEFHKAVKDKKKVELPVYEYSTQRKGRKSYKRASRKHEKRVQSMSTSRWQTLRRDKAIGNIQRHHARAERAHDSVAMLSEHSEELAQSKRSQKESLRQAKIVNAAHRNPQVPSRPIERTTYMAEPHYGVRAAWYRKMSERAGRHVDTLEQTSQVDDEEAQYVVSQTRQRQARHAKRSSKARLQQLRAKHKEIEVDVTGLV